MIWSRRAAGLLALCSIIASGPALSAEYATGGASDYRDEVLWLTWGDSATYNSASRPPLNNGTTTSASIQVAGGVSLDVTCTLLNIVHQPGGNQQLFAYRPGDWSGDSLDDLYNIGGTGTSNQLINGIMRGGGISNFTVSCTATLGGDPFPLKGLVMADAEAINGSTGASNEYVQATADGHWFAVEMRKNPGAGTYMAQKSTDGRTIRFGPGTDDGTAAVTFLAFDAPSPNVSMDFEIKGGGNTAIAIGLLAPYADFSDAPASYGEVMHLVADMEFQPDNIPEDGNQYNLNTNSYDPGGLAPPNNDYLGSRGPDTELEATHTDGADGENAAEEDAWPQNYTISVLQTGEQLSETILCTGTGTVAAWIDFDRNGTFDQDERTEAQCSGTDATLSWTIPETLTPGVSYIRLRYSNDVASLAVPTGTSPDGEVEDHSLTVLAPSLAVTKGSNAASDVWQVDDAGALYQLTVTNNGPVATGNPPSVAPAEVTVLDLLPDGILPNWTGTHTNNGWSCTFSGQLVTCVTDQILAASGQPGNTVSLELPVELTADALGDQVNYASVGGGRDPFNNGTPPAPGPSCSDADHCADYTVTVASSPAIEIDKTGTLNDADGDGLIDSGESITYSFLVTNTGNVTLTDVTVNDALVTVDQGPQTLAPRGTFTFTATYTPTQDDIDSGSVQNTATATGTPPSGPPVESPPDSVTVPPEQTPGLSIDKTGTLNDTDGDGFIDLGETITYSFLVTNTGTLTLSDVTVDDEMLRNAQVSVSPGPQTLSPGGSVTFTATYAPTQGDIDSGQVENTATATGTTPSNIQVESPPDTAQVPPDQTAGLTIDKTGTLNDTDGDRLIDLGETISYTFLVTNAGTVTLTDVTVDDPMVSVGEEPQTLAPGASFTFTATYTATQDDINNGSVTNTARATGVPPSGPPLESPPDSATVPPDQTPALIVDKTGTLNDSDGDGLLDPGESISYSFLVTNTGTVTLTDVTVDDPLLRSANVSISPGPQTLAPRGRVTFTATYEPSQDEIDRGSVENTARATGTPPSGTPEESPPDTATVPPEQTPALSIEKTGRLNDLDGDGLIDPGETIGYSFLVINTGTLTLSSVTVDDPLLRNANVSVSPGPQTLAPRGRATFTATYTPTQTDIDNGSVENTATARGTPPSGPPVESSPDSAIVPPDQTSQISIEKTGTLDDDDGDGLLDQGETITFSFLVTNTGNVTLTDVTVDDPLLQNAGMSVSPAAQTLASGASATFTATYTPGQDEVDNGSVENTARATGINPAGARLESPPDTAVVPPDPARLVIQKTGRFNDVDGDGHASAGDTLTYSFTIANDGGQTVTNVWPEDEGPTLNGRAASGSLSRFTPEPVTLRPGAEASFTATYTLSEDDIASAAGISDGIVNSATARGRTFDGIVTSGASTSIISLPAAAPAELTATKIANLRSIRRGEQAPFTIRVTNNAPARATDLTVVDMMPAGFRFVEGSATVGGVEVAPEIAGRNIRFAGLEVDGGNELVIQLRLLALSSAGPGEHVNRAMVEDPSGRRLTPVATAVVEILAEPVFDCGDIVGKVFDDGNLNGYQDDGERGLAGVRMATVNGWLVTTDAHGRFHVACADLPDSRIGSNFIMKLDPRTLPTGYRLTTENPRVVRLTAGKMTKLNFGAALGRVVRLDLREDAFVPGETTLNPAWAEGMNELIHVLSEERSVLRLSYFGPDTELAEARMDHIEDVIAERWRSNGGRYRLEIESRMEMDQ
ncbi:CshA/CshB family fibrillar adhesin-related protein [Chelativorans alearense]|uniref:CshA/CshB family fibrillar adhesin-related protein n=1 Tax=Chelativorans alearense TaxID=2681495 RepID=UPI0013D10EFD|nr:CshA/CshB family fibrillar adhesin-related protein [Chelativorans alearense]